MLIALTSFSCAGSEEGSQAVKNASLKDMSLWAVVKPSNSGEAKFSEIKLKPAFQRKTEEYKAEVGYDITSFYVLAFKNHPGASLEAMKITPDGTEEKMGFYAGTLEIKNLKLNKKTSPDDKKLSIGTFLVDGADFNEIREKNADLIRTFKPVSVGDNTFKIKVAGEDGETTRTYTVTVARDGPDMNTSAQRDIYFAESLKNKNWDEVKKAIDAGADVNKPFKEGRKSMSSLAFASIFGQEKTVHLLIQAGADVNTGVINGDKDLPSNVSPLMIATAKELNGIVRLLIEGGADVNYALTSADSKSGVPSISSSSKLFLPGISALLLAINAKNEQTVGLLIKAGADPNQRFPDSEFEDFNSQSKSVAGVSPLILASSNQLEGIVRLLIETEANVNYEIPGERQTFGKNRETAGLTALRVARTQGNSAIERLLLEAGTKDSEFSASKIADGVYRVAGSNPNGSTYKGTVKITHKERSKYTFAWKIGPSSYAGTGELKDNVMTVKWGTDSPAIYKVEPDGTLNGTWAKGKGTEILTPTR